MIFAPVNVGGFNPIEKYWSKWESSPGRGGNKKYFSCHHPAVNVGIVFTIYVTSTSSTSYGPRKPKIAEIYHRCSMMSMFPLAHYMYTPSATNMVDIFRVKNVDVS